MPALALLPPPTLIGVAFVFGLMTGSFLNVVIHRLPLGESIVHPRSRCPSCRTPIAARDNVPVLSYLWLRGRCRHCGVRISLRYPTLELATGLLFAAIAWRHGADPMTLVWLVFAGALVAAAAIDFDHRVIPDEISLGGLALGLLVVPGVGALSGVPYIDALVTSVLGALLGFSLLWVVGFSHARLCAVRGRRFEHWPEESGDYPQPNQLDYWIWFPGMGFGDVKLLAMIGAGVGPMGVAWTLVAASFLGLVLGLGWAVTTRRWSSPFGFGPAIAAGAIGVVLAPTAWLP